jgi:hypothetical protein
VPLWGRQRRGEIPVERRGGEMKENLNIEDEDILGKKKKKKKKHC